MNEQFKAGDEVYCPLIDLTIHTIHKHNGLLFIDPALATRVYFQPSGSRTNTDTPKNLFHATPENKLLLEALYKCDFESPKLKGSDLTRKLLSEGRHVLCYVSDSTDDLPSEHKGVCAVLSYSNKKFHTSGGNYYNYAAPCNDYANLVDGVLEVKK
jgi:hypothetical protein